MQAIIGIAILPCELIPKMFEQLVVNEEDEKLEGLNQYIQKTWMDGKLFTPKMCSVFKRKYTTNNNVEGWHNGIIKNVPTNGCNFFQLINLLHDQAIQIIYEKDYLVNNIIINKKRQNQLKHD